MKFARGIRFQALLLTVVPLAFLLLLLSLTGLLARNSARSGTIAQHSADSLGQANAVMQTLTDGNRSLAFFSKSHRAADQRKWVQTPGSVRRQSANLTALVRDDPAVRAAAARYVAALNRALTVMSAFYADVLAGRPDLERSLVAAPATQRAGAELTSSKALFDRTQQADTLARLRDEHDSLRFIEIILTAVALAGSVATIVVLALFGFHIVRRLELLAGNARRIAAGEPTVGIAGSDEIAVLDGVYRRMTARMLETHHEREAAVAALERERNVAATLQKALLPNRLPEIAGLRFDAAYVTPSDGPEIGGDWFDVFPLDERHVGLSVGDVSGHGLRAAVTMGALRQSIRAAARIAHLPSQVLGYVNHMHCTDEPGTLVTAFFGVLDRETGTFVYAYAGHPAPIVIEPDQTLRTLAGEGLALGVDPHVTYLDNQVMLMPGNALVLYTDGLVEARRDYIEGMRSLEAAIAAEMHNPALNMADGIQLRVFDGLSPRDDSAVLVVTLVRGEETADQGGSLQSWRFDGRDAAGAHRVRRAVVMHLEDVIAPSYWFNLEVIVGEVLSNIARHTPGPAQIISERRNGAIVLHVEDEGAAFDIAERSRPDPFAEHGRGLALIRELSEGVRLERTATGNRLSIVLPGAGGPTLQKSGTTRV